MRPPYLVFVGDEKVVELCDPCSDKMHAAGEKISAAIRAAVAAAHKDLVEELEQLRAQVKMAAEENEHFRSREKYAAAQVKMAADAIDQVKAAERLAKACDRKRAHEDKLWEESSMHCSDTTTDCAICDEENRALAEYRKVMEGRG